MGGEDKEGSDVQAVEPVASGQTSPAGAVASEPTSASSSASASALSFHKAMFKGMISKPGLLVTGKGVGALRTLCAFIRLYSDVRDDVDNNPLVLALQCTNCIEDIREIVVSDGGKSPRVITSDMSQKERQRLYKLGGCYIITSRILVVDLLTGRLAPRGCAACSSTMRTRSQRSRTKLSSSEYLIVQSLDATSTQTLLNLAMAAVPQVRLLRLRRKIEEKQEAKEGRAAFHERKVCARIHRAS